MKLDAFTSQRFAGNPAAVMLFERYPDERICQALAAENNLAETAFLVPEGENFRIRWFTPTVEVPLCGHATLASAAVVLQHLEPARNAVVFHSASGPLTARRSGHGYVMDFPARRCEPVEPPEGLAEALGVAVEETVWDGVNVIARLATADDVRVVFPDLVAIARMPCAGVIVTAPGGGGHDCVSRYHCGAVRFTVTYDPVELTTCDCSLCVKRNAVMAKVPEAALRIDAGEELLATYQWNSMRAKHHFCTRCGIYVFHRKRAAPDHFGVNIFCLDGFDATSLPVRATAGIDMTLVCDHPREEWPGPRVVAQIE